MIRVDKLRGIISERGMTQSDVAKSIGISPKTFYLKMKKGVFGSDEVDAIIALLDIKNPYDIFYVRK